MEMEDEKQNSRPPLIRQTIWYEFIQTKYGELFLSGHITRQREARRWYKIATLVFSASGILSWRFWEAAPVIACGIVAAMQLFALVENQIIPQEKVTDDFCKLKELYVHYVQKMEQLWLEFEAKKYNEQDAIAEYSKIRKDFIVIEVLDSKLTIKEYPVICKKARTQCDIFIKQYSYYE